MEPRLYPVFQCIDAVGGRPAGIGPVKTEWWGAGMVICLEQGATDFHMVQLMQLPPHHLLLH